MPHSYARIIDQIKAGWWVTIDPFKGHDGTWGVSIVNADHYFFVPKRADFNDFIEDLALRCEELVCFDVRRIMDWPINSRTVDIKSVFGGEKNLPQLVAEVEYSHPYPVFKRFLELDQKIVAHGKAAKLTGMNIHISELAPKDLLSEWIKARVQSIDTLYSLARTSSSEYGSNLTNFEERWSFIRALHQVELNGIYTDEKYVAEALLGDLEPADVKALRSMQGLSKGGFVTSLFNPMGSKTGRVRLEGGFNAMGIPHGPARKAIISRFEGGSIYTFDFNAIDYRCIVSSIGGDFEKLYANADDFHARTASFLFNEVSKIRRDIMKFVSYVYIYGGSVETLMEKTKLERQLIEIALKRLDEKIKPIAEFREHLYMKAQNDGFIDTPGGKRIHIKNDDHPGKVLGLYAQTYSSYVFEQAFTKVQMFLANKKTCIIFSVHDELVLDVSPDEESEVIPEVKRLMETTIGNFKVSVKKGSNYGEVK